MAFTDKGRSYENVQHSDIRQYVDEPYMRFHDALSDAYYNDEPFEWDGTDYGVLDEATFEAFHQYVHDLRTLAFHWLNRQTAEVPEDEYRYRRTRDENGNVTDEVDVVQTASRRAARFQTERDDLPSLEPTIEHPDVGQQTLAVDTLEMSNG